MKTRLKDYFKTFLRIVFGIQILRVKNIPPKGDKLKRKMKYVHDPAYSFMVDQEYKDRLVKELSLVADDFRNKQYLPSISNASSLSIVDDFFNVYSNRNLTENTHGSGFHNAFWLYYIARVLDPELVVESGVWKGHTSWLFTQACPQANQYGFDINLEHLEFHDLPAQIFEQDWGTFQFPEFNPDRAVIFFDCHINHAQRILEAKSKGFKHLLFDDNPPVHKIFSHVPGIPTAAMLAAGEGIDSTEISWVWNGAEYSEPIDPEEARQAKDLIIVHYTLPDVGGLTRYGGFTFLTYVQL